MFFRPSSSSFFFFFNDTAPTEIYTLSLHDALPISSTITRIIDVFPAHQQPQIRAQLSMVLEGVLCQALLPRADGRGRVMIMEILVPTPAIRNLIRDRKSTRLNSSHGYISYAVFCLK